MSLPHIDFQKLEALVRSGEGTKVVRDLRQLVDNGVRREEALGVAALARRVNQTYLALRVLNPVVRPSGRKFVEPTAAEKAEYAASLTRVGAVEESLDILRALDPKSVPEALLFQAFALVSVWDYASSIPLLLQYLRLPSLDDYRRLVGMVNLAAAYVHERRHGEADDLLSELLRQTKTPQLRLLHSNTLQLSAQSALWQEDWQGTAKLLDEAEVVGNQASDFDLFFIKKWKIMLDVLRSKGKPNSLRKLHSFKHEAYVHRHWETARDCDLIEAICRKDLSLVHHLYFGTPFESFRRRVLSSVGYPVRLPQQYVWCLKGTKARMVPIDLFNGEIAGRRRFKVGHLLHRAMVILSSDFYRPFRIGSLGHHLYPGEYFNPLSTPVKIHEAMKRLRQELSKAKAELIVEESSGSYFLSATGAVQIRIHNRELLGRKDDYLFGKLREKWPGTLFSLPQACEVLQVSPATALRLINKGIKDNRISRTGKGNLTRYQLSEAEPAPLSSKISV